MRPLHACLILPYLERGGTESHALTLAGALSHEHRVTLLAPAGAGEAILESVLEGADGRVKRIAFERFDQSFVKAWRSYRSALRSLLREDPPDLLHVHGAHELVAALPGVARRQPVIFTCHGYHGAGKALSYRTAAWMCNRRADAVIAVSGYEREQMLRHGFRDELVHLIHNGIEDPRDAAAALGAGVALRGDLAAGGEAGLRADSGDDVFTVGVVARLEKAKGIEWLIRAVARIAAEAGSSNGRICCVIVGTGSEEESLRALARSVGVAERVRFAGYIPHAARMMETFDLFVLPSIEEPFGLVCVEAMASELPVVATRVGGIPEIVKDGETGLLVPPADDEALAKAILRLASDPGLRRRMGEAGRRRFLEFFTAEAMARKTVELYERVLGSRRPQP